MTTEADPYHAYMEGSVWSSDPISLVVALYEGAVESVTQARRCLETGDIWGRAKAVTKAVNILTELLVSLDGKKGGEIATNLARLYNYMQRKIMEGHASKSAAAFEEVEKLLRTLLGAWHVAAKERGALQLTAASARSGEEAAGPAPAARNYYADYFAEPGEPSRELAFF